MNDMTDGYVQVAPDSTGKKVDNTEVTRSDTAVVVERQRVEARDEDDEVLSTAAVIERLDLILDAVTNLHLELQQQFHLLVNIMKG